MPLVAEFIHKKERKKERKWCRQVSGRKINFLIDVLSLDRNFVYLSKIYCAYFLFISSMFILLLKEMFALH